MVTMSDKKTMLLATMSENKREDWYDDLVAGEFYPEHGGHFVSLYTPDVLGDTQDVYALFTTQFQHQFQVSKLLDIPELSFMGTTPSQVVGRLSNIDLGDYHREGTLNNGDTGLKFNNNMKSKITELSGLAFEDWYIPSYEELSIMFIKCSALGQYLPSHSRGFGTVSSVSMVPPTDVTRAPVPVPYRLISAGLVENTGYYLRPDPNSSATVEYRVSTSNDNIRLVRKVYCCTKEGNSYRNTMTSGGGDAIFTYSFSTSTNLQIDHASSATILPGSGIKGTIPADVMDKDEITLSFTSFGYKSSPKLVMCPLGTATETDLKGIAVQYSITEGVIRNFLSSSVNTDKVYLKSGRTEYTAATNYPQSISGITISYRVTYNKKWNFLEFFIQSGSSKPQFGRIDTSEVTSSLAGSDEWWIGCLNSDGQSTSFSIENIKITGRNINNSRSSGDYRLVAAGVDISHFNRLPIVNNVIHGLKMNSSPSGMTVSYLDKALSGGDVIPNMGARFKTPGRRGRGTIFRCEMDSSNFFTAAHGEHFAIGIRGNIYKPDMSMALTGKGVVLGNVTGYPSSNGGVCQPTDIVNALVAESFYEGGNCVYGDKRQPQDMKGVYTNLVIIADDVDKTISFSIANRPFITIDDVFYDNSDSDDYWWVGIATEGRTWEFNLKNASSYHYNDLFDATYRIPQVHRRVQLIRLRSQGEASITVFITQQALDNGVIFSVHSIANNQSTVSTIKPLYHSFSLLNRSGVYSNSPVDMYITVYNLNPEVPIDYLRFVNDRPYELIEYQGGHDIDTILLT